MGPLVAILHAALFANHALPVKASEVLRPALAARAGVPIADATVSTVVARLLDVAALLGIAAALLPLTTTAGEGPPVLAVPALLVAAVAGALLWIRSTTFGGTRIAMLDRVWLNVWLDLWLRVREALRAIPPRAVLRAFVLTVPSWLIESVVVYGAAQALGLELSLTAAAAVTAFTILFQVVHLTPGGIGVFEASMTAALQAQGMPGGEALTLAVLTQGLKFAYAFGPGALLAVPAVIGLPSLGRIRASRKDSKRAGRFEIVAARLWNVLNEGKPFTPVFVLGTLLLLGVPHLTDGGYWLRQLVALVALAPLFVVFYRYAFPLRLRAALWSLLAVAMVGFRAFDVAAIALVLALFFGFTVVLWGSISRGSYYPEYLERIEATDRLLEAFIGWRRAEGYLDGATVMVTSDHGQGRGIGGHGHLTEPEQRVPFIAWGEGVPRGVRIDDARSLLDVAPTLAYYLGTPPPAQSVGQVLFTPEGVEGRNDGPLAIVIPAYNEAEVLPDVLARMPRAHLGEVAVIVVVDGSTDGTAGVAERAGADLVVRHPGNRGLGAALRTGLDAARGLNARAAVYLDADLEYDPAEIPAQLAPIEADEADYVLGSRFLGQREGHAWWRSAGNRVFTLALSFAAGRRISDGQTGFRAFSADALNVAEIVHDYNYAQVLTLDLLHKGMRLAEVPISYRRRSRGRSFINGHFLWHVSLGMARELLGSQA